MIAPPLVIAMPWTPIFGGTKHFLVSWVFLALFAGLGFERVVRAVRESAPAMERIAPTLTAAVLLAPGVINTAHSHPFGLSFYGFVMGGVLVLLVVFLPQGLAGAASLLFNRRGGR